MVLHLILAQLYIDQERENPYQLYYKTISQDWRISISVTNFEQNHFLYSSAYWLFQNYFLCSYFYLNLSVIHFPKNHDIHTFLHQIVLRIHFLSHSKNFLYKTIHSTIHIHHSLISYPLHNALDTVSYSLIDYFCYSSTKSHIHFLNLA